MSEKENKGGQGSLYVDLRSRQSSSAQKFAARKASNEFTIKDKSTKPLRRAHYDRYALDGDKSIEEATIVLEQSILDINPDSGQSRLIVSTIANIESMDFATPNTIDDWRLFTNKAVQEAAKEREKTDFLRELSLVLSTFYAQAQHQVPVGFSVNSLDHYINCLVSYLNFRAKISGALLLQRLPDLRASYYAAVIDNPISSWSGLSIFRSFDKIKEKLVFSMYTEYSRQEENHVSHTATEELLKKVADSPPVVLEEEDIELTEEIKREIRQAAKYVSMPPQDFLTEALSAFQLSPDFNSGAPSSQLELPKPGSTEKYSDRSDKKQNAIEFYEQHWKVYADAGLLHQQDLKRYDPKLMPSIRSYCRHHGLDASEHLPPTKSSKIDKEIEEIGAAKIRRLARALERRGPS